MDLRNSCTNEDANGCGQGRSCQIAYAHNKLRPIEVSRYECRVGMARIYTPKHCAINIEINGDALKDEAVSRNGYGLAYDVALRNLLDDEGS